MRTKMQTIGFSLLCLTLCVANAEAGNKVDGNNLPVKVARSGDKSSNRALQPDAATPPASSPGAKLPPWMKVVDPNPVQPRILLSQSHQESSIKQVGDSVGDATVVDIDEKSHKLTDLLSDRLTVLIFWSDRSLTASEQFARIPVDVLGAFARHRVKVIAVNVGGDTVTTRKLTGDAADKIVSLVDADAKLFKQFAKSKLPRTYVIDKNGNILWYDLEYSLSMRRELSNALAWHLKKNK